MISVKSINDLKKKRYKTYDGMGQTWLFFNILPFFILLIRNILSLFF